MKTSDTKMPMHRRDKEDRDSNDDCREHKEDFGCMLHAKGLNESIGFMPMKPKNHTDELKRSTRRMNRLHADENE